jgi:hypothetical protein
VTVTDETERLGLADEGQDRRRTYGRSTDNSRSSRVRGNHLRARIEGSRVLRWQCNNHIISWTGEVAKADVPNFTSFLCDSAARLKGPSPEEIATAAEKAAAAAAAASAAPQPGSDDEAPTLMMTPEESLMQTLVAQASASSSSSASSGTKGAPQPVPDHTPAVLARARTYIASVRRYGTIAELLTNVSFESGPFLGVYVVCPVS